MRRSAWLLLALSFACKDSPKTAQPGPKPAGLADLALPQEALRGVSGLAQRLPGEFWAVGERNHLLVPLRVSGEKTEVAPAVKVVGVPEGFDLEALAFLDADHLVFGTEADVEREQDAILLADLKGKTATISGLLTFDYQSYGIKAKKNKGVEALCVAGNYLVAISEMVLEEKDQRFAPLGIYQLQEKKWHYGRIQLTSKTGKISALSCTQNGERLQLFAIERHYEVMRLISAESSLNLTEKQLSSKVVTDLAGHLGKETPNLEGLALGPNRIWLISDNEYTHLQGPTHWVSIPR